MSLKRRLLIGTVLVLGLIVLGWWLTRPEPVEVRVAQVERGSVESLVANTRAGTIMACRRAKLSPPSGGQIDQLAVREGDRVEVGALLLSLWNQDLVAGLELAEREADAAEAHARAVCLNAERTEREAARQQRLKERDMASEEAVDQANTAALAGRADCESATASTHVASARAGVARADLERTRLIAPFAGIIAEVNGEQGEYATPSPPGIPTPPAVDLIDDSCFYISAPIDEVDAAQVRLGMGARVTLDAFGDQRFQGEVRRIAPYVLDEEKQARTVEVEVVIQESMGDRLLLAGYSADVEILIDRAEDVLWVPTVAVRPGDPETLLVLDRAAGRLVEQAIQTGLGNWEETQILEGVEEGDLVVLSLDRDGVEPGVLARAEANNIGATQP